MPLIKLSEDLLERFLQGDVNSFEQVYSQYAHLSFIYISEFFEAKEAHLLLDVQEQVFLKLYMERTGVRSVEELETKLFEILSATCHQVLRDNDFPQLIRVKRLSDQQLAIDPIMFAVIQHQILHTPHFDLPENFPENIRIYLKKQN